MEFEDWMQQLKDIMEKRDNVSIYDEDCWREYFDDGYTPQEAYDEDLTYA